MKFFSLAAQTVFSTFCLLTNFAGTQVALAQVRQLQVSVPFAFESGSHRFAAGDYRIEMQPNNSFIGIRSLDGKNFAYSMVNNTMRSSAESGGKLIFQRYGGRLFLKQVWLPNDTIGMQCPPSRAEREARIAAGAAPYTTVMLALLSHP